MQNFTFSGPYGDIECIVNYCDGKSSPVLIMTHGFRGSRDGGGKAIEVAEKLSKLCTVIRFNFNGSQILSKQVEELQAVIATVQKKMPEKDIFLLGRSLGGAASIITAAKLPNIRGLILWATPNNLRATFADVLGQDLYKKLDQGEILHLEDERGKIDLVPEFLTDIDKYNLDELLQVFTLPILILHGAADEVVKVKQAKNNYAVIKSAKELHIFPNGDHSLGEYSENCAQIISVWLKKQL